MKIRMILLAALGAFLPLVLPAHSQAQTATPTPPPVMLVQNIDPLTATVAGTVTITDVACNIASVSPGPSTVTDVTDDPTAWGMYYPGPSQFTVIPSNSSAPPVTVTLVSGGSPGAPPAFSLSDVPQGCTTFSFPVSFTGGDIATQCRMVNHGVLSAFFISVPSNNVTLTSASCSLTPTPTATLPVSQTATDTPTMPVSVTSTDTPTAPVSQTVTDTPTAPVSMAPTDTATAPVSGTLPPTNTPGPSATLLAMQVAGPSAAATVDFGSGGSVVIPAGAVSAPTTITITGGPVPPTPPVPGFQVQGIYYNFTANDLEGAVFAVPVALTFPYDPALIPAGQTAADLRVVYFDPASVAWVSLVPTVDTVAHTLKVVVNHFSWWAVGAPVLIPTPSRTPTPSPTLPVTLTATSTPTATPSPSNPGPTLTPTFSFGHGCEDDPCDLRCEAFKVWDREDHPHEQGHPMRVFLNWHAAEHGPFKRPDGYLVYRAAQDKGPYYLIQTLGQLPRDREGRVQTTDDPGPGNWCYTVKAFEGRSTSPATSPCCTRIEGEVPTPTPTPRRGGKEPWHSDFVDVDGTPASTAPETGLAGRLSVGPNPSRDGQPVRFVFQLGSPARITLSLFTVGGERVYVASLEGQAGSNELVWPGRNFSGTAVASGLYCYVLSAEGEGNAQTRTGKVAILH